MVTGSVMRKKLIVQRSSLAAQQQPAIGPLVRWRRRRAKAASKAGEGRYMEGGCIIIRKELVALPFAASS